jgi:hypothetical protein
MITPDLLAAALRRDPSRPLLTWYADATGERVELSVATTANWVAKTANWLSEELDVGPLSRCALRPGDHWLTFVCALAVWSVDATVDLDGTEIDGTEIALPGEPAEFPGLVLAQPDVFVGGPPSAAGLAIADAARRAAEEHGLPTRARVLSVLGLNTVDGLDAGLLLPLAVDGSVVLVAGADPAKLAQRCANERVTHTAGIDVPGVARLL